jgi:N,N'-diacetylchitobiose transport system permease protein
MTSSPAADTQPATGGGRGVHRGHPRPRWWQATVPSAQTWRPWLLLAPALAVLSALLLYPLARVVVLSFQEFGLRELNLGGAAWVGFANYRDLLSDPRLWQTVLGNTVVFAIVNVVLTVAVGTLVALLLFSLGTWTRGFVTTAIMVAWAIPAVTGTYVWIFIFDSQRGPAMRLLDNLGLVDPRTTNWFDDRLTFYAIATLNVVHHGFPFVAVTVLAGLMTIPKDVFEAATIDGAGGWRRFWSITAPTLKPVFAVVTILSTIWDFKVFVQIYLMPGGNGVNRDVLNLATWSYITAFGQGNDFGRGSAIAVLLTLVLIVITMVYLRFLFREQEL